MLAMQGVGDSCACLGSLDMVARFMVGGNVGIGVGSRGIGWDEGNHGEDLLNRA